MNTSQPSGSHDPTHPCIRNAEQRDIPEVMAIIAPYVDERVLIPRDEKDLQKLVPHGFVAEAGGNIVGFAAVEIYSRKLAEVQCLAVLEGYQNQGLGKKLVDACVNRAREEQVFELLAITSSDEFLRSCGFDYSLPDQRRALFMRTGSDKNNAK